MARLIQQNTVNGLILEAGQAITLERPSLQKQSIDTLYGSTPRRAIETLIVHGYCYSDNVSSGTMNGASTTDGITKAVISAKSENGPIAQSDFTPGCVLVWNGRRYRVSYGLELRHQQHLLAHRLELTPEESNNARY